MLTKRRTNCLKGVNLGCWLLMEGYILGGKNIAESQFKEAFEKKYGFKELRNFEKKFRSFYIQESDFKNIADLGAKVVRVPFNYRLLEKKAYQYDEKGFVYLDDLFRWANKYQIFVILDLHAAPGSQNCDWHSDSSGKAFLWSDKESRMRTYCLWEAIVSRYKDQPYLAGYDLLNEPVIGSKSTDCVKNFYKQLIKRIRKIDSKNIIFLEGDIWAQRIEYLADLIDDKIEISVHTYRPLDYSFNFSRFFSYPGMIEGELWDKDRIYKYLEPYYNFSVRNNVRIFVGEFGINWRGGYFGETKWLDDLLTVFDEFDFDYSYWTYKAVSHYAFPDGLYQYLENSPYIARDQNASGLETYLKLWGKEKSEIADFWKTDNYHPNREIIETLRKHFLSSK